MTLRSVLVRIVKHKFNDVICDNRFPSLDGVDLADEVVRSDEVSF